MKLHAVVLVSSFLLATQAAVAAAPVRSSTSTSAAAPPPLNELQRQLAEKVFALDHFAPKELKRLEKIWIRKCENKNVCFISERDVGLSSSDDRVLLFRGEPLVKMPGISMILRNDDWIRKLCPESCTFDQFSAKLESLIAVLPGHDFAVYRSTDIVFDFNLSTWKVLSHPYYMPPGVPYKYGELLDIDSLPSGKARGNSISGSTVMDLLVSSHVSGAGLSYQNQSGERNAVDAMISLTTRPSVAQQFATGRVLMVSIPKTRLKKRRQTDCSTKVLPESFVLDTAACQVWSDTYSDEHEYDAFLMLTPQMIRNSFLTTH